MQAFLLLLHMKNQYPLIAFFLLVVSSCNNYNNALLADASSVLDTRPDSALLIISKVDTSKFHSSKQFAKYELLKAMAIDKCYIDTTDISIMAHAQHYYQNHGERKDRMLSRYYYGRLLYNSNSMDNALEYFLDALNYSDENDPKMMGMIHALLSAVYRNNYDSGNELKHQEKALDYFSKFGNPLYIEQATLNLGSAFHNNRFFDKADSLYSLIPESSPYYKATVLERAFNKITDDLRDPSNVHDAIGYFEEAEHLEVVFPYENMYQFALALNLSGNSARSESIIKRFRIEPSECNVNEAYWLYRYFTAVGNKSKAFDYFEAYATKREETVKKQLTQSLQKTEANYYRKQTELSKLNEKRTRNQLIGAGIIAIIFFFVVIIVTQRQKIKIQKERSEVLARLNETQRLLALYKTQEDELQETHDSIMKLQVAFTHIYKRQFVRIGRLYNTNLVFSMQTDPGKEEYVNMVSSILSEIESAEKGSHIFEARIDKDLDNIMTKLRSDFPEYTEDQYRLLCYVIAGFTDASIATIMNENNNTIRSRKSRLKKEIFSRTTPNSSLYRAFLT